MNSIIFVGVLSVCFGVWVSCLQLCAYWFALEQNGRHEINTNTTVNKEWTNQSQ